MSVNSNKYQAIRIKWDVYVLGRGLYLLKPTTGDTKKFQPYLMRAEEIVSIRLQIGHTKANKSRVFSRGIPTLLTHWGRLTHICVSRITNIGSDNGLSLGRHQTTIWTNVGILLIRTLGTNFSEILSEIHTFSFKKMHLKMSSAKWRPFCLDLNVLNRWCQALTIDHMECAVLQIFRNEYQTRNSLKTIHDDVIKWKHFPRYWPFVRGNHRSPVILHTKTSDA